MDRNAWLTNIDQGGQRRRLYSGVLSLLAGVAIGFYFINYNTTFPRAARLVVFVPFLIAMLGFMQATRKVCVVRAAQGTCEAGANVERIGDAATASSLRRTGVRVLIISILDAAALTAVCYFIY
ncbi:MAG: hypothetical protein HY286_09050 [Planctomycetes bacterium]|nr:hypothetical protein [Planctomycetota bacterium]